MRCRLQRARELLDEEQPARHRRHEASTGSTASGPCCSVTQRLIPCHMAPRSGYDAVRPADAEVALQEQPRADRVREARDQREAAA